MGCIALFLRMFYYILRMLHNLACSLKNVQYFVLCGHICLAGLIFYLGISLFEWDERESNSRHHGLQPCALPLSYRPMEKERLFAF
jgi:uncharacterized membrane protein YozB (DUF420 family)